jgi:hypothetical protein
MDRNIGLEKIVRNIDEVIITLTPEHQTRRGH